MKKIATILFAAILLISGCSRQAQQLKPIETAEFSTGGNEAKVDHNNLLVNDGSGLKIFDLAGQEKIKEIPTSQSKVILGFDISENTVVWSDLRNEKKDISERGGIEKANADVFMYYIKTGEVRQLTTDTSSQLNPKVWGDYIIYQDNRNDSSKEYPGMWSLYLYNLKTGEEKEITKTLAVYPTYNIMDNKVVWEDERNFKGDNIIRGGENLPENNKDIYMYDILKGTETEIAAGKYMESSPDIFGDYVVYEDRNNNSYNADIVLYNINTKEKKFITRDKYNQGTPGIYGDYVVWMDERRGTSTNDVVINGKLPNSDIFMYNIKENKEYRVTGDGVQILPSISSNWIAFTNSIQVGPTIGAVRYK